MSTIDIIAVTIGLAAFAVAVLFQIWYRGFFAPRRRRHK